MCVSQYLGFKDSLTLKVKDEIIIFCHNNSVTLDMVWEEVK